MGTWHIQYSPMNRSIGIQYYLEASSSGTEPLWTQFETDFHGHADLQFALGTKFTSSQRLTSLYLARYLHCTANGFTQCVSAEIQPCRENDIIHHLHSNEIDKKRYELTLVRQVSTYFRAMPPSFARRSNIGSVYNVVLCSNSDRIQCWSFGRARNHRCKVMMIRPSLFSSALSP